MPIDDVSDHSIAELVSLSGRVAVVTGGAQGIGLAVATRLAEAGASVVIGDVNEGGAVVAAEAITARGYQAIGALLDVRDEDSIIALATRTIDELGALDVWVNNAGIYPASSSVDMTVDQWNDVNDVNLRGVFLGSREAARRMIAAGHGGVIVNIASTAGYRGKGLSHYVATKHGVRGLTRTMAVELGRHDIRVLGVAPGVVATPGMEVTAKMAADAGIDNLLEIMVQTDPLGRPGVGDDIARVVLFCASDLSVMMTGSTLPVDGGALVV